MTVGNEFIESYKQTPPENEVVHLDLYKADIPYLDADVFNDWKKLRSQSSLQDFSTDERLFKRVTKRKKALHIQARADIYSHGPEMEREMGHRYLKIMMDFFSNKSFEIIIIEGQMKFPEQATHIKDKAIQQAKEMAKQF